MLNNNQPRWSKKSRKGQAANPVKNKGSPDRKAQAKLAIRIKDWSDMTGRTLHPCEADAYHKPGSMQR